MNHPAVKGKNKLMIIISTLLVMYLLTGLALLLLALLLFKMQLSETIISAGIMAIYIISCLTGGILVGKRLQVKKFLWGLIMGVIYFLLLLAGSFLTHKGFQSNTIHIITTWIMCMAAGMIGGMIS